MRMLPLPLLFAAALVGCAPSAVGPGEAAVTGEWRRGDFRVRFQAGPRGIDGRAFSFYEIHYAAAGGQERRLIMESAHSLGGFAAVTDGDPEHWIRIVADQQGRALLIEEVIPNDCGPCSNYLWVRADARGWVEGTYLRLPAKAGGSGGGIDEEYPRVRSLDGVVLRYGYSTGAGVTQRLDEIEKADHPVPPG